MVDANSGIGILLLVIGAVLIIAELVHPGVFILVPGTIFIASGIMYLLVPDFLVGIFGPVVVAAAALVAAVGSIYWYQFMAPSHKPLTSMPETLSGLDGIVVAPVVPDSMRGKVRVRSEVWSARSRVPIAVGTRVRILGGEGVCVDVVPFEPSGSGSPAA